jgi:hypothetical protein
MVSLEVDETGSGSFGVVGFGVCGVILSDCTARVS